MKPSTFLFVGPMFLFSCTEGTDPSIQTTLTQTLNPAPCQITVHISDTEHYVVNMETDPDPNLSLDDDDSYVANVVKCEHGEAPWEALKAQAVMARSLVFYRHYRYGVTEVGSGTSFQVYQCTRTMTPEQKALIRQAVMETKDIVVTWLGFVTWTTYTAGTAIDEGVDHPGIEDDISVCEKAGGTNNWQKTGCDVKQTDGIIPPPGECEKWPFPYNRGAAVQHGCSCLARRGWDYRDVLKFYYGADIQVVPIGYACNGATRGPEDEFCVGKTGWYCVDDWSRAYCRGDQAEGFEECNFGCIRQGTGSPDICAQDGENVRPEGGSEDGSGSGGDTSSPDKTQVDGGGGESDQAMDSEPDPVKETDRSSGSGGCASEGPAGAQGIFLLAGVGLLWLFRDRKKTKPRGLA